MISLFAECGDCDATSPGAISYEPLRDFQLMVVSQFSKLEPKHRGLVASDRLIDLYLPDKSGHRFTIVRFDKISGAVRAISGDEARASLRAHCDRVVGAYTQPGFDLVAPIATLKLPKPSQSKRCPGAGLDSFMNAEMPANATAPAK